MPQHFPDLPPLVPQRGTHYSRALCKKIFLSQGWKVVGDIPNLPKQLQLFHHTPQISMDGMVF